MPRPASTPPAVTWRASTVTASRPTAGRILLRLSKELERRGQKRGLISICAAGGMAGAMIVER